MKKKKHWHHLGLLTYMLTNAAELTVSQQLQGSSSQRFLLPLDTEHKQLLPLFFTEGLAVAHLEGAKVTGENIRHGKYIFAS